MLLSEESVRKLNTLEKSGEGVIADQGIDHLAALGRAVQLESALGAVSSLSNRDERTTSEPIEYLVVHLLPNRRMDGNYIGPFAERLHGPFILRYF